MRQRRIKFIEHLFNRIYYGYTIIYVDETSTNLWEDRGRLWLPQGRGMQLNIPST